RRGFGDLLAGAREIRRDAASLALAFAPFLREGRGGSGERLVAREERALLVAEAKLVALPDEMGALGLDARGPRFGEGHACARRLLLSGARAVGRVARAPRGGGGLVVDTGASLAETRELSRQHREG